MGLMKIACRGVLAMGLALTMLAAPRAGAAPERDNFAFLQTSTVRVVAMRPGQVDRGEGRTGAAGGLDRDRAEGAVAQRHGHGGLGDEHVLAQGRVYLSAMLVGVHACSSPRTR